MVPDWENGNCILFEKENGVGGGAVIGLDEALGQRGFRIGTSTKGLLVRKHH
jgi:hypothetical protein